MKNIGKEKGTNINISIDVTKIVKYVTLAGVLIVGIIFGTRFAKKMMEEGSCFLTKK